MTDKFNEAMGEQLKKNVWDRTVEAASQMSALDRASLVADVAGIFDPTPASDFAGLAIALVQGDALGMALSAGSMLPYAGDALAKPLKIARKAPAVAKAIEAVFKAGDDLVKASRGALQAAGKTLDEAVAARKLALKEAGLSLDQVAAARKQALESVQKAMLDAKARTPNCESCKLVGPKGEARELQLPAHGGNGTWKAGAQPVDGTGTFVLKKPAQLPDGRSVSEIEFVNGAPQFDAYVTGGKHQIWEVTGDVRADEKQLLEQMRMTNAGWQRPDRDDFTLHHFEDGSVGYVPNVIHDKKLGGVAHTGGNSMTNNQLF